MGDTQVPVVELKSSLRAYLSGDPTSDRDVEVAQRIICEIGDSLARWGFVSVTGHGVDSGLLERAYDVAREVFALSDQQKQAYEDAIGGRQRGYTPLLMERAKGQAVSDLKEFWHVGRELAEGHPYISSGLMRPNLFPQEVERFRSVMLELYQALDELAHQMLGVIERYLKLQAGQLSELATDGNSVLRVLHYPALRDLKPEPGSVRAAAHEDINLLTLLPAATSPGLQLLTRDGDWLDISPPAGSIILDTGDMMSAITGGEMPATTHRVINPTDAAEGSRLSMPFFMHPRPDARLERLVEGSGGPVEGVGLTAQAFLDQRLAENGLMSVEEGS